MICYLDTSVLVKLYVLEQGTREAQAAVAGASVVATSRVAYAEAMAAFARKLREGGFTPKLYGQVRHDFHRDWDRYFLVEVTQQLVEFAAELARRRALRGFDAIHLASALLLQQRTKAPVHFFSSDVILAKGAKSERLKTPDLLR